MKKFYAIDGFKAVIIIPLLTLVLGLSPFFTQADMGDQSGVRGPTTDGHLVYFPIPSDISREEVVSASEPVKHRLFNLVNKYLAANQNQNVEEARDLVVIFTDQDGQPILPDADALRKKISELGVLADFAEAENKLTFTFNSPQYPWSAENLSKLQTMLTDFYQTAVIVYGYPAFNITVNVRQNPSASASGLYYSSLNEMVIRTDDSWDIMVFSDVVCHEMIHAFRDDFMISLNSYEEGMTRAAEIEVFNQTGYSGGFEHHHYYYDVYYESLNSPVIGGQAGSFSRMSPNTLALLRYQLAGYAWAKPLLENPTFLAEFNGEYYANVLSDSMTRYTESKLLGIAISRQPAVEGKSFLTWYGEQGILNTNPPRGYFLHHRPGFTVDFFYRDASGNETMQSNATIVWAVYDFQDRLLDSGSEVTTSYGWMSFVPTLPSNYQGRIKVEATASTAAGITTHTYYTVAPGSQLKKEGIFGVTPDANSGTVTITWLDSSSSSVSTNLLNGAFSISGLAGARGRFIAKFTDTSGKTFSKQFNKDASSYFLLMLSPPVNSYPLTATKTGTGSGTLSASGLSCTGNTCTGTYPYNTPVTITAAPATGSAFTGWTGCDSVSGNVCTVTINANKSVSAGFALNQHTLTATKTGTGSGTLSASGLSCTGNTCTGTYPYNTPVTITAAPATGSAFTGWTGCDSVSGNVCTVTINANKSVDALFALSESSWNRITQSNPETIAASDSYVYGDFGPGGVGYGGIWKYDGSTWAQITQSNPETIAASDSYVYGDFGPGGVGYGGIWKYDGSTWAQITQSNPETIAASDSYVYGDFGPGGVGYGGIWKYDGSTWAQITQSNPETIAASDSYVYGDFGPGGVGYGGIWKYDGSTWAQITQSNPETIAASDSYVYGDFGPGGVGYGGIWKYDGSTWAQITQSNPETIAASDSYVYGDFGPGGVGYGGIWKWQSGE